MMSRSRTTRALGLALGLAGSSPLFVARPVAGPGQVAARDAFAREPKTPLETWEVASYLIRVGQPDQAAPYVKKFIDANPDDAALLEVRDRYGVGSILRLSDYPETRPYARTLAEMIAKASIRHATDPGADRSVHRRASRRAGRSRTTPSSGSERPAPTPSRP